MLYVLEGRTILELQIMSFNLRYWNEHDGTNSWPQRRKAVAKLIHETNPAILGTQEGLRIMLQDLDETLPAYGRVGESRSASGDDEFCAIYYRQALFELIESKQIWLSETPDEPGSKSWDSSLPRICTLALLKHRPTGKQVAFLNTHLDHLGEIARLEGAKLILELVSEYEGMPCILTGDMNCHPRSAPIQLLTSQLTNALGEVGLGEVGTFHEFTGLASYDPIDYIFVTSQIQVLHGAVLDRKVEGVFPSDHFPISALVRI